MSDLSRRTFSKQTLTLGGALSLVTLLGLQGKTRGAGFDPTLWKNNKFLKRDDVDAALKSLYVTYDSTYPYDHKFNETITKTQLRTLQFCIMKGIEKDYVKHYITTMQPLLQRIKKLVEQEGPEKGIYSMFEGTSCSYQLYERINIKENERSFPCPYKAMLGHCKKYLKAPSASTGEYESVFTITWNDVCSKWCIPVWTGFAESIGITIAAQPGEICTVKVIKPEQS